MVYPRVSMKYSHYFLSISFNYTGVEILNKGSFCMLCDKRKLAEGERVKLVILGTDSYRSNLGLFGIIAPSYVQMQSHYCSASFFVLCFYEDINLDEPLLFLWIHTPALHVFVSVLSVLLCHMFV